MNTKLAVTQHGTAGNLGAIKENLVKIFNKLMKSKNGLLENTKPQEPQAQWELTYPLCLH